MNTETLKDLSENNLKLANLNGLPKNFFKINRENFFQNLKKINPEIEKNSLLIMEGGKEIPRHDTDTCCYHFIQEPYFYYLSGVTYPDFHMVIDLEKEEVSLFIRMPSLVTKIFMHVLTPEEVKATYDLECYDDKTLLRYILNRNPKKIYSLSGVNTDSGLAFKKFDLNENFPSTFFISEEASKEEKATALHNHEKIKDIITESEILLEVLADTRTVKSEEELEVMKFTAEKTVEAHLQVMKKIKDGQYERDAENFFYSHVRKNYYSRELPYSFICGCGHNSSTLHYVNNDMTVKNGQLILLDMGTKIAGYCSDVTITVPVSGKYTQKQKEIYDTVLKASREVMGNLKAGVKWTDMHLLAERVILTGLQSIGILNKGFDIDEMVEKRVGYYFMPHGLGHLIGIDVHDVGGYLSFTDKRICEKGLRGLRTARVLRKNTAITVEPGVYFISSLLEQAFKDEEVKKYFNSDLILKEYLDFGGIRIEDVVVVKDDGCINFCEKLPRTTEDIEKIMGSG